MTRPSSSTAVVPATATHGPTRTAREYPTIGSHVAPDEMFRRSIQFSPRRTIVGPAKNPRVNLATVRRPQKFREFVGGLVREFRRRLPAREVPPVPFLEVADDSEEIRLQAVMGGTVVQGGPDNELAADRDDSELVVSHGRGRIAARAPHARLDEIPDDGEQAFEGLRLDGQVATRREGHEGFSRAVEQVHRDRAGGFQQASS